MKININRLNLTCWLRKNRFWNFKRKFEFFKKIPYHSSWNFFQNPFFWLFQSKSILIKMRWPKYKSIDFDELFPMKLIIRSSDLVVKRFWPKTHFLTTLLPGGHLTLGDNKFLFYKCSLYSLMSKLSLGI